MPTNEIQTNPCPPSSNPLQFKEDLENILAIFCSKMNYLKLGMVDTNLLSTIAYFYYSWWQIPMFFVQTFMLFFVRK